MKPKRIRVIKSHSHCIDDGDVLDVIDWSGNTPIVYTEMNERHPIVMTKWEPVQEFKHGDPVWAWDSDKGCKCVSVYVGVHPMNESAHVIYVPDKGITVYKHVEHRKPTITLKELAEKAGIDLDEYELIEERE